MIVVIAERWVCANEKIKQNNKINTNIVCTKRLVVIFGVYNVHTVRIYYYMFHSFGFVNLDQEIILPRHTLDLVKINVFCLHTFIYSVIVVSLSLYGCMLHFDLLRFFRSLSHSSAAAAAAAWTIHWRCLCLFSIQRSLNLVCRWLNLLTVFFLSYFYRVFNFHLFLSVICFVTAAASVAVAVVSAFFYMLAFVLHLIASVKAISNARTL